jgi:serine/threonine protein kinase
MGSDAEPPSDIYSLGLVLLQSLTGEVAYPGRAVEAAAARLHRPPRIPPELGQHWTDLLAGMTDRDPQARPNATEVASRLRDGLSQPVDYRPPASAGDETAVFPFVDHPSAPVPQRQPSEPDPSSPKQRRRLRPLVLISALALALIAVLVILMLRPHSSATNRPTPPAYPSVSGQLGADLRDLQRSVQ